MRRQTKILQFKVIIEQDEDSWYVADVPELPGCHTQAKTLEQLRERVKEVIKLVLEADQEAKKDKLSSPQPHTKPDWNILMEEKHLYRSIQEKTLA